MQSEVGQLTPKPLTGRKVFLWLVGFFGVIFTANAVFLWFALGTFPGVSVESSYKAGQAYNQDIADARVQVDRAWQVEAGLNRQADGVWVEVVARDKTGTPLTGLSFTANLYHPTNKAEDKIVSLTDGGRGTYSGLAEHLPTGIWNLVLEAEDDTGRVFRSQNRVSVAQ